jgi:SAM-dependent methyltransferase
MLSRAYEALENWVPDGLKKLIPEKWRVRAGYQVKVVWRPEIDHFQELLRPLEFPPGETEPSLVEFLSQYREGDAWANRERDRYLHVAFRRFLYTLQMLPEGKGKLLEIGSHPYFISLLLGRFTSYRLTHINYFGDVYPKHASQSLIGADGQNVRFEFDNVNIENEILPYGDDDFEVVIMCEVLEHLTNDPQHALLEIKRVLKPGGTFVLTTPNVSRSENVARLLAGQNTYDQYSGYGPYGRHNREYTVEEMRLLLEGLGFEIDELFTSDIGKNKAGRFFDAERFKDLIWSRKEDLGEHIFVRASNGAEPESHRKPAWLYRSYPENELESR